MEENKILRNRLRELGIKIADLSRMLNISRKALDWIIDFICHCKTYISKRNL